MLGVSLCLSCSMSLSMLWAAPDGVRAQKRQLFKPARCKNPSWESERREGREISQLTHHSRKGDPLMLGWRGGSSSSSCQNLVLKWLSKLHLSLVPAWTAGDSSAHSSVSPGINSKSSCCPQGAQGDDTIPFLHPWHVVRPLCSLLHPVKPVGDRGRWGNTAEEPSGQSTAAARAVPSSLLSRDCPGVPQLLSQGELRGQFSTSQLARAALCPRPSAGHSLLHCGHSAWML